MDDPVPLMVDFPEVHRVVPSRLVPVRTLHLRAGEIKVERGKGFHPDSGRAGVVVRSEGRRHDSSRQISGEIRTTL